MSEIIKVATRFKTHQLTAKEYLSLSKSILLNLREVSSVFNTVCSWGSTATSRTPIAADFSNFEDIVLKHIYDEEINYLDIEGKKSEFSINSKSWTKFSNSYSNMKGNNKDKYLVSIAGGGESGDGFVNIEIPSSLFSEFSNFSRLVNLIINISKTVILEGAYAYTKELHDEVVDYDKDYDIEIGWVNFFKDKNVLENLSIDIQVLEVSNGVFLSINETINIPSIKDINTAIAIRDILGEKGFLNQ